VAISNASWALAAKVIRSRGRAASAYSSTMPAILSNFYAIGQTGTRMKNPGCQAPSQPLVRSSAQELAARLQQARTHIGSDRLAISPQCGFACPVLSDQVSLAAGGF